MKNAKEMFLNYTGKVFFATHHAYQAFALESVVCEK